LRSQEGAASLLIISLMKQRLSLEVAFDKVRSKFLLKILHLSIQAFERSTTRLAIAGTNPDFPWASFSYFEGLVESSNLIFVII
jgi:hypothetical protein